MRCGLRAILSIGAFAVAALLASNAPIAFSQAPDAKGVEFFENKIRPVLVASCYECHSAKSAKVKGGLLLDTKEGLRAGGDSGPAIIVGKPEESLLIKGLRHSAELQMPPKNKLADRVVNDFVKWVEMGAPDPRKPSAGAIVKISMEDARQFWSYKPLAKPAVPKAKNAGWARSEIDRFVLAKLEEKKLKPVADADRATLIRRATFDLTGLPPSPEEVEAYQKDSTPQAFEKVVDRLMASPHYGERWGRFWLDIARYAESNGNADNTPFPNAWRYRDYVIAALNKDKPYDRFVTEQVAGDLLPAENAQQRDDLLIATGFLALTSKPRAQNNPDYRMDLIADQIDVTTRGVLGLSVMCARCHDHKFDPIPTKEYYSLAGIFDSSSMLFGAAGRGGGAKGAPPGGSHVLSDGGAAMGVKEGKMVDTAICVRGESQNRAETVQRGFLTVASVSTAPTVNRSQSGRLELAQWMTKPDNPLTARVAVNRIWLHLFGQGLVKSADNFGALGEKPSHPELLDYLATRFIEQGWSTKKLIRDIMLSHVYQLGSSHDAANAKADPDNVWLWRMSQRRLDAEATRDAILTVSGQLERTPPKGSLAVLGAGKQRGPARVQPESKHRSVYLGIVRGAPLPESLAVFDIANPNLVVAQREVTTVPSQALYLMNSPFIVEQSKHLAQRLIGSSGMDDPARVDLAYRLGLARAPSEQERQRVLSFIRQAAQDLAGKDKNAQQAELAAWAGFCQAMFASAEFRYLR